jgi:hypothetical protein
MTVETRRMTPQEKKLWEADSEEKQDLPVVEQKSKNALDLLVFIPITAGIGALFWLVFAVLPFATGERSVTYEKVNANIIRVEHEYKEQSGSSYSRRGRGGYRSSTSVQCKVIVSFNVDGKVHTAQDGDVCNREVGMRTPITYDPKDISGTASSSMLPAAHANVVFAAGATGILFGAAGLLTWLRKPLKKPKLKKRRRR